MLVGDKFFRAMAGFYLRKLPPTSPLMMFYGDMMPKFLRRFEPAKSLDEFNHLASAATQAGCFGLVVRPLERVT